MDPFTQLIYSQRPDVQGHPAGDWWNLWGAQEMRDQLQRLGRQDVLNAAGNDNNWLREWYTQWGSKEYPNIWQAQSQSKAPAKQTIDKQYSQGGEKAAPTIPQFENVLPWQQVEKGWMPGVRAVGEQYVGPEVQRQYQKDLSQYMMGMASAGGGRFGRGWGGVGDLGAAAQRSQEEQVQDYISQQLSAVKGLWYDPLRSDYQRARDAGDVYGRINVPTWQDMTKQYPQLTGYSETPGYSDYTKGASTGASSIYNRKLF